jgi:hypothetical protein
VPDHKTLNAAMWPRLAPAGRRSQNSDQVHQRGDRDMAHRADVGNWGKSGLVMLKVSFVTIDPTRTLA